MKSSFMHSYVYFEYFFIIECFEDPNLDADFEDFDLLREVDPSSVQEELSLERFISVDSDVVVTASIPTDAEIVSEILDPGNESDVDTDIDIDGDEEPPCGLPKVHWKTLLKHSLTSLYTA